VLDPFDTIAPWTATPSDGVSLTLHPDSGTVGRAMRMDVDFHGGGGYAVAHRALPIDYPANYAFSFWLRSDLPPNTLEFKLIDSTGQNVWWATRRDMAFPRGWSKITFRKRQVSFAWGPSGGGELRRSAALEISVTAGNGGKGSVWLDELALTPLPPPATDTQPPRYTASSGTVTDGGAWRSAGDGEQAVTLDFGASREYGGLAVDWDTTAWARDYDIQTSDDGRAWTTLRTVRGAGPGRRWHLLTESESRWLRLQLHRSARGQGYALRRVELLPLADGATPTTFLERIAAESPEGRWPRGFRRQASYWTIVGPSGGRRTALIGEDGAIEPRPGSFSLEPFVLADGRLSTWHDGATTHALDGGGRPIPSVRRTSGDLALDVSAFAEGRPERPTLWARYRVVNGSATARRVRLAVAVRPLQVNPPYQFLNLPGGAAEVRSLTWNGSALTVNGTDSIAAVTRPNAYGALAFDAGSIVDSLAVGALGGTGPLVDSTGLASGAFVWNLALGARDSADVVLAVPSPGAPAPPVGLVPAGGRAVWEQRLGATRAHWDSLQSRATLELPPSAGAVARTLRTALAHVLVNRDGPAIRPGTRSYARSWIRDGALTSTALLKLGHADAVRAFLAWFAPYQYATGKVPCCVDRRGADPVPENDSHGELVYLVAEYWRHTGDTATVRTVWPNVVRAVAYMDSLRRTRTTPLYQSPDSLHLFGLLPPSISHEGYSDRAAYSYWDDFFALRGLSDAALLARVMDPARARAYADVRDAFQRDLAASIGRAMTAHRIAFIPGAADRGDFDATSTTIALAPGNDLAWLPRAAVQATFDRYWTEFVARRDGTKAWDAYTPYEWRVVGSFVRLGQPERAWALIDWFMKDRRPTDWNQWAEVVWRDARAPKFIGDMPHGWVESDFMRSALDLLAYEREADSTLVVGGGVPLRLAREGNGVALRGLSTWWGPLDVSIRATEPNAARVVLGGRARAPGGVLVQAPFGPRPRTATIDGAPAIMADGAVRVRRLPATIVFRY
jgi:hypothetical protein